MLPEWIGDATGDAAIWVTGFKGRLASLTPLVAAEGIATAIVDNTVVVSCYCRPSKKGPAFLSYLQELEVLVLGLLTPGRGVILAGDFNSKSPAWGRRVADRRGPCVHGSAGEVGPGAQ